MLDPERTEISKRKKPKCPICGNPTNPDFKPFCSDKCQKVDLHRWLGGVYRIETDEPALGDDPESER